jgi:hypothetical protein
MSVLGDTLCVACQHRMRDTDACTDNGYPYVTDGEVQWLTAIPYGDPREDWADHEPPGAGPRSCQLATHCHDCGVATGSTHHWGCDVARCPNCDQQLLGCQCEMRSENELEPQA